jgi:hypothetical protein
MSKVLEQDTLELPTVADTVETEKRLELINSIDLSMVKIKLMDKAEGVDSYHSTCRHPGVGCGTENHRGDGHGGYCYYCKLCN